MPAVTITLTDTPTNGVSVHSDFTPAVGNKLSPAQVAAMEIMLRTSKQWGMPPAQPHRFKREPGKAYIITGRQGAGHLAFAREIAEQHGNWWHLETGPSFSQRLKDAILIGVKTLIIEGTPSQDEQAEIKNIVANDTVTVRPPYCKNTFTVKSPLVIICTLKCSDWISESNRRFDVINLDQKAAP